MRVILYTGKGGVGKTTVSAATAILCADLGYKTIVISTDAAHSLSDSLAQNIGPKPVKIRENLYAQEVDVQTELENNWGHIQRFLSEYFYFQGIDEIIAEELAIFPGLEELFSLLVIRDYYKFKEYEVVIVDCAPTGASLRMFSLPDVLQYYMNKIFPIERQLHKVFRPIGKHILGIPLPKDEVYGSLKDLYEHIKIIRDALVNPKITSIRLVVNPEGMVIKEAQRAYTYLNLFNFSTDAVIVNKLLPRELMNEDYFNVYKEIQNKHLLEIKHQFEPLPIFYVNQIFNKEVVGEDILIELAKDLFKDKDPTSLFYTKKPFDIIKKDGKYIMSINLPFTDKEDLEVLADRDEVTIRLKNYKRNIFLPKRLTSLRLESAHFEGGKLRLSFGEREVINE